MSNRDCSSIFAMLSEYLDRDLPEGDCAELETHIRECEPCVAFVESLKKSVATGRGYSPSGDAPELKPEVKESLKDAYEKMLASRKR